MANDTQNNEETNDSGKVSVGLRMDADLHGAIAGMAAAQERPVANMIIWLVKQHPAIQAVLEPEPQAAGSGVH